MYIQSRKHDLNLFCLLVDVLERDLSFCLLDSQQGSVLLFPQDVNLHYVNYVLAISRSCPDYERQLRLVFFIIQMTLGGYKRAPPWSILDSCLHQHMRRDTRVKLLRGLRRCELWCCCLILIYRLLFVQRWKHNIVSLQ